MLIYAREGALLAFDFGDKGAIGHTSATVRGPFASSACTITIAIGAVLNQLEGPADGAAFPGESAESVHLFFGRAGFATGTA